MTRRMALLAALPLLLLAAGALFFAWLLGTTSGAEWAVHSLAGRGLTVRRVEGRLLDRLRVDGAHLVLKDRDLRVERLEMMWRPLALVSGRIAVTELLLSGVVIVNNAPETHKRPDLGWPTVPARLRLLQVTVDRFQVEGLSYRRGGGEPFLVERLSAAASWRNSRLTLADLATVAPRGGVSGTVGIGLGTPSLDADLTLTPATPVAALDRFNLRTRLTAGKGDEHLAGEVALAGSSAGNRRFDVAGRIGVTRHDLNLYRLRVTRPGGRGRVTVDGAVSLTAASPVLGLEIQLADLDLAPEARVTTALSGRVFFSGTTERYRGQFDLTNRGGGWHDGRLVARYRGDGGGVTVSSLTGSLLDGTVTGDLDIRWQHGLAASGTIGARNLNPGRFAADWRGVVNFELDGRLTRPPGGDLQGEVAGRLLQSTLHGQPLTGSLQAAIRGKDVTIGQLDLHGRGFDLAAAGDLARRLALTVQVADLSRVIPRAAGELRGAGWVRYRESRLAGNVTAHGRRLAAGGISLARADVSATLQEGRDFPFTAKLNAEGVASKGLQADTVVAEGAGTVAKHTVNVAVKAGNSSGRLGLAGGYKNGEWRGEIRQFAGNDGVGPWTLDAPVAVSAGPDRIEFSTLSLTGQGDERFTATGRLTRTPATGGRIRGEWHAVRLSRANPWLREAQLAGAVSGQVDLQLLPAERVQVKGKVSGSGTVSGAGYRFDVRESSVTLEGGERGVQAVAVLALGAGGEVRGEFSSAAPARLALPEDGKAKIRVAGLDLTLLRPWLSSAVEVKGKLDGTASGKFLPGQRLEFDGEMALATGTAHWEGDEGEVNLNLRSATVSWGWRGESLGGSIALRLAEYGELKGDFRLPVPARLPLGVDRKGALSATFKGAVREQGVLATVLPGLVQESHGEVTADIRVSGSWDAPEFGGALRLAKAGAYVPSAGIHLRDVQLTARLARDSIQIDSFQALSGAGRLQGTAVVTLTGWKVTGYRGSINGDRFQTVFLPEMQLTTSPQLLFAGNAERLQVRGEVVVPEMIVVGEETRGKIIQPSKDVVIEGRGEPAPRKKLPLEFDVQVQVVLGDRVLVKESGIDAQLGGSIRLVFQDPERITSTGQITVVKGSYKTYGVDLKIVRGRLFYSGGPVNRPTLDFLALRTSGDVKAGVTIAGTPRAPVIKLYSEPSLPDVDILSYIVLGHPLGSSSEQASLLAGAAGALLSAGQSVVLQDRIRNRLGLEIGTETTEGGGRMGYKEITPSALGPAKQASVSQTMVTVGKYLTPELYISYGRSLFTGGNLFRLRYDIYRSWQIQTETGTESGVDLFYKIDFN